MRRPIRYALAALVVFVLAAAAVFTYAHRGSDSRSSDKPVACAYTSHSISALSAFSSLVGRDISCALIYNSTAANWDQLASPWFLTGNNADYRWDKWLTAKAGRQLVIAESLVPAKPPANWRALGANGAYDAFFQTFADKLVAAGLGRSVIRIAAEGNGNWFVDNAGSDQQSQKDWARYWARVARILHKTKGGHFTTDWTVSGGPPAVPLGNYYPGNDAVDIVGLDQHDLALPAVGTSQPARWNVQDAGPNGVRAIVAFAHDHYKAMSVPEWGVHSVAKAGAGDDTYYMQQMAELLRQGNVAYDGYWEKSGADGRLTDNPKALQIYRQDVLSDSSASSEISARS